MNIDHYAKGLTDQFFQDAKRRNNKITRGVTKFLQYANTPNTILRMLKSVKTFNRVMKKVPSYIPSECILTFDRNSSVKVWNLVYYTHVTVKNEEFIKISHIFFQPTYLGVDHIKDIILISKHSMRRYFERTANYNINKFLASIKEAFKWYAVNNQHNLYDGKRSPNKNFPFACKQGIFLGRYRKGTNTHLYELTTFLNDEQVSKRADFDTFLSILSHERDSMVIPRDSYIIRFLKRIISSEIFEPIKRNRRDNINMNEFTNMCTSLTYSPCLRSLTR